MAKLKVEREKAVVLFQTMGFKMADDWDDGKLLDRIGKITEILPDDFDPEPEMAELCLAIQDAAAEGGPGVALVDGPEEDPEPEAEDDKEPEVAADPEPEKEDKPKKDKPKKDKPKKDKPKKDKPKKDKPKKGKDTKRGEAGPEIDGNPVGVRSIRNRLFCAGQVLQENGLSAGLSEELIQAVDDKIGKSNLAASKHQLSMAWHVLNGYLNG